MPQKTIHIGCGAGFSGDRVDAAIAVVNDLKTRTGPCYLIFETLAERTLAAAQRQRQSDSDAGHAPNLLNFLRPVLADCKAAGIRIISNFGAANPRGAAKKIIALAEQQGIPALRVAIVEGDDLFGSMPEDDLVKGMYIAYMQEYARVNGFMVEQAKARSEKASKASNARWGNVDPMLENADPMLKHASIDIGKDIGIGKDTAIGKGKAAYNNYINSINE